MREEVDREAEDPAAPAGKASQAESSLAEPPAPTEPKVPTEPKAPSASLPLAPYDPENPVGEEPQFHVLCGGELLAGWSSAGGFILCGGGALDSNPL